MGAIESGVRESSSEPRGAWPSIPVSWTARARRPAVQGLFAFAIYLVVFIAGFGQPLIAHPSSVQVGQSYVDPNFYVWAWRWWTYAVSHGLNPLYSTQIGAPTGYNLAWATTVPPVALLMWPITAAFGPAASLNIALILAPPLSAWAAFIAARRLTGRFWAALAAGAVYGFNLYELAHEVSGQPNLTVTFLLPLMVYLAVRRWQGSLGPVSYVAWMTIVMALEFYTFMEAFADMTAVWAIAFVIGFVVAWREAWRTVARLLWLTVIAYAGAVVLASPYLSYALKHSPTSFSRQTPNFSLDLAGLILPRTDRLLGQNWLYAAADSLHSQYEYVGIPLLLVLLALAVFTWSSKVTRLLAVGFVVIIALAAGPSLMIDGHRAFSLPWGGLWSLPFARSAEPVRLIDFGYLVLALVVALWLAAPVRSRLWRGARVGLAALGLAVMFANLPVFGMVGAAVPLPASYQPAYASLPQTNALPAFISDGLYKRYLRPGEIVVVVSHRGNAGMLFQAQTGFYFRIAGGFINFSLTPVYAIPKPVELLSHTTPARIEGFHAYMKASGVGAIIVEHAWSEHWMYVFGHLGMRARSVGGVTIFTPAPTLAGDTTQRR